MRPQAAADEGDDSRLEGHDDAERPQQRLHAPLVNSTRIWLVRAAHRIHSVDEYLSILRGPFTRRHPQNADDLRRVRGLDGDSLGVIRDRVDVSHLVIEELNIRRIRRDLRETEFRSHDLLTY
jgi:hypothetical protein